MEETLQEDKEFESKETVKDDRTKIESSPNQTDVSDLLAALKSVKTEEQELLSRKNKLQATQNELVKEVVTQIDAKKKGLAALKSEVAFLQNKCNELERALGIPVYE